MAEIQGGDSGGGKHQKKGRKKGGNPKVDMTPMVDLAFLLLTFFVLTSNLNKMKTMEITMPKEVEDTTQQMEVTNAVTILLDGNKDGKIYYFEGKLTENSTLFDVTLDPKKGFRKYAMNSNKMIVTEMKTLREKYKKGTLTDSAFKAQKSAIHDKHRKEAPFYIVKWGADAKYSDVINIIDELKICDIDKYALVTISRVELSALSSKTGTHYPELDIPDPADAGQPK